MVTKGNTERPARLRSAVNYSGKSHCTPEPIMQVLIQEVFVKGPNPKLWEKSFFCCCSHTNNLDYFLFDFCWGDLQQSTSGSQIQWCRLIINVLKWHQNTWNCCWYGFLLLCSLSFQLDVLISRATDMGATWLIIFVTQFPVLDCKVLPKEGTTTTQFRIQDSCHTESDPELQKKFFLCSHKRSDPGL